MLLIHLKKTIQAASYARLWMLLTLCVLLCAVLLGAIVFASSFLLLNSEVVSVSWLDGVMDVFGVIGIGVLVIFLFPALLPVMILLFHEKVASIIEQKEYPACTVLASENVAKATWHELKFLFWVLFLNIICLPLYFIPLINIGVYYLLNSYLLGNEVFNIISARYVDRRTAKMLWKSHRTIILSAGFLMTVLSNIPFLNLVTPLFAIILMVHVTQAMRPSAKQRSNTAISNNENPK